MSDPATPPVTVPAPATAPVKVPRRISPDDVNKGNVFRVREGGHIENDASGKECFYNRASGPFVSTTPDQLRQWPEKFEQVGGTILLESAPAADPFAQLPNETATAYSQRMRDLAERATKAAAETKVMVPAPPPPPKAPDVDSMTVDQLKKFAAEREIKLAPNMSRADILKAVKDDLAE